MLESISQTAPELETRLRQEMLTLEDLLGFSGPGLKKLLTHMDNLTLAWPSPRYASNCSLIFPSDGQIWYKSMGPTAAHPLLQSRKTCALAARHSQ